MLQDSPDKNFTCEQVLDARVAMMGENTATQQQQKRRVGGGVPIDKREQESSANTRTPAALARNARAR